MEKKMYRKFYPWLTWNIKKEEGRMTAMSAKGIQLVKPGVFWNHFSNDDSAHYVYRVDFQNDLQKKDKFNDYVNLYQDAGWEYVGSVGKIWHYFRKVSKAGETHELYTDHNSLKNYYKRIQTMMGVLSLSFMPIFGINIFNLFSRFTEYRMWTIAIPATTIFLIVFLMLVYGYVRMGALAKALNRE